MAADGWQRVEARPSWLDPPAPTWMPAATTASYDSVLAWRTLEDEDPLPPLDPPHPRLERVLAWLVPWWVVEFVGPQLRWWIWNYDIPTGKPTLGATPYVNIQAFCIGIPLGMAFATRWIATTPDQSAGRTAANIVLVSLATWPVMFLTGAPSFVLDLVGLSTETARVIGTWLLVVFCAVVTLCAFVDAYRARVRDDVNLSAGIAEDRFALIAVAIYLVVAMITWVAAFPDFLNARDGLTPGGDPIGSLPYGIFALVACAALLVGAYAGSGSRVAAPTAQHVDAAVAT